MTREQFENDVTCVSELIEFCNDHDLDYCSEWVYCDDYDQWVCEDINDSTGSDSWEDIRDWLNDLPTGYDFYIRNGRLDYYGMDEMSDEFYSQRESIADQLESDGFFDYEGDEDDEDEDYDDDNNEDEWDRCITPPQPVQQVGLETDVQFLFG